MIGFYNYTVILTYCSLISAIVGTHFAFEHNYVLALFCLMLCGFFDFLSLWRFIPCISHFFAYPNDFCADDLNLSPERKKSPPEGRHKKRTWQLAIVASSHYRRRYDA